MTAAAPTTWNGAALSVWLGTEAGTEFHVGDELDGYGVLGPWGVALPSSLGYGLWADHTCNVVAVDTHRGASPVAGFYAATEAGTATLQIIDTDSLYNPVGPAWPRWKPGCPVLIWAEADGARYTIFTGSVASISEPWTARASERWCTVVCTDGVADAVARERPELLAPAETTTQRVQRIVDAYDLPQLVVSTWLDAPPDVDMQPALISDNAWAELQKVVEAEIGFVHVSALESDPFGPLSAIFPVGTTATRWLRRTHWDPDELAAVEIECDIILDAETTAADAQQRTRVTGRRALAPGETDEMALARSVRTRSVSTAVERGYSNHELGVIEDEVIPWVEAVLAAFQEPDVLVRSVTLRPGAKAGAWPSVLDSDADLTRPVELEWGQLQIRGRCIGIEHSITSAGWEVRWALTQTTIVEVFALLTEGGSFLVTEDDDYINL